jgi:Uma2 family endonuclease
MTGAPRLHCYTVEQYRIIEEDAGVRHEFLDGEIYAMAGGTPEHAAMSATVIGELHAQLRAGRCRVQTSDARVRVQATGLITYPDVSVVCGPVERDSEDPQGVTNPTVIVEVLSPSTEDYDRGLKPEHYQRIATLRDIVLVAHDRRQLEHWTRDAGEWSRIVVGPGGSIVLGSIAATLAVDDLYDVAERGA